MNMAAANELWDSGVDLVGDVNVTAMASRSLAEFEATVLPSVKTCFGLSVSSLSNRHTSIADMPDRVVFCGVDAAAQLKYQRYYRLLRNPVRQRVACPEAETYKGILDSQDVFEDSTLREEPLYREFHGPQHMDRSLAIKLTGRRTHIAMLGLWRSRESGGFTPVDLLKIRCIAPVLANVYGRLTDQSTDSRLDWLTHVLAPAEFNEAIVLLDTRGHLLYANPTGHAALSMLASTKAQSALATPAVPCWLLSQCHRAGLEEGCSADMDSVDSAQTVRVVRVPDKCGGGFLLRISRYRSDDAVVATLGAFHLSNRELEVAHVAAKGLSTKQIAHHMSLSFFTVQDHLKSIYKKLGVNNRAGLMRAIVGRVTNH
jgi:DNA-binding CsgD family transcriptional regulator